MTIIAKAYLKGIFAAQAMTVLFATLALFITPIFVLMGGGIALVTMSVGLYEGLMLSFTALIVNVGANWAIAGDWQGGLIFSLLLLIPLVASAYYLNLRLDLARAVSLIAGFVFLLASLLAITVPEGFWLNYLKDITELTKLPIENSLLEAIAPFMNSVICFLVFFSVTLSLLLGRYWQSQAYNKGAFAKEFLQYRLSPWVASINLILIVLAFFNLPPFKDVAWVLVGLFVIQGLAVIHFFISIKKWPTFLLTAIYFSLFFLPSLVLGVAVLGLADVWFNLRFRPSLSE